MVFLLETSFHKWLLTLHTSLFLKCSFIYLWGRILQLGRGRPRWNWKPRIWTMSPTRQWGHSALSHHCCLCWKLESGARGGHWTQAFWEEKDIWLTCQLEWRTSLFKIIIYSKSRVCEKEKRENFHVVICPTNAFHGWSWTRLKPAGRSSILISHCGWQWPQVLWARICCLPDCGLARTWFRSRGGTPLQAMQ